MYKDNLTNTNKTFDHTASTSTTVSLQKKHGILKKNVTLATLSGTYKKNML
jgi:hypothetical protein